MTTQQKRILRSLMKGNRMKYVGAIAAMTLSVGISFLSPLMLAGTIDGLVSAANGQMDAAINLPNPLGAWFMARGGIPYLMTHLWMIAAFLIVMYAAGSYCQYLRGRWTALASERFAKTMRDELYRHLQSLGYDYHVKANTGDLIQRCTSDVETIRRFLASQFVEIFRAVAMVTIATLILLGINVQMTLRAMLLVPLLFAFALLFFRQVRKQFQLADEAEGKLSTVLQENLTGVRVVRAFGREQYEDEKFDQYNDDYYLKSRKLIRQLALYWSGSDGLSFLQTGIAVVCGAFMVVTSPEQLTVGQMVVFISYVSMLLWPVRELGRILSDLGKAIVSFGRVREILETEPESDAPDAADYPLNRDIEFRHVSFAYDDNREILQDINLTVRQGQTVALLGATGSGKSTMMHLLQRLYDVSSGEILIGGVDIRKIRKQYLRSRVGLILQEPFLYSRSVRGNIGIVRRDSTDDMICSAARLASAHEFIREFENGYDTMVGERGVTLSGGQKQRVAIARTLLKQNDILIFDDSLSAVDSETDRAIRKALNRQHANGAQRATTFIVSHRLTTLAEADVIAVMQNGRIAQLGTHEQLVAQEGMYRRIYLIQSALEDEMKAPETEKGATAHAV